MRWPTPYAIRLSHLPQVFVLGRRSVDLKPGGIFPGAPRSRLPVASTASSKGSSQGNAKR